MLSCCIFTQFPGECLLNCRDQTQFHGVSTGLSLGREKRVRLLLVNSNNHGRGLPSAGLCWPLLPSTLLNILQANWFSVKTKDWYLEDHTFTLEQENFTTSIHCPLLQFNGGLYKCCNVEAYFWRWLRGKSELDLSVRQLRGKDADPTQEMEINYSCVTNTQETRGCPRYNGTAFYQNYSSDREMLCRCGVDMIISLLGNSLHSRVLLLICLV